MIDVYRDFVMDQMRQARKNLALPPAEEPGSHEPDRQWRL